MKEFNLFTLKNDLRIIYKQVASTKIVHCGIAIDVGSRDEMPHQFGIAHFWEHMAFKGTKNRKSHHILQSIDSVGGELNAYTTKEKVYFYISVLDKFADKAFDILSDITFNSVFPEQQIERERQVILEEMAMYKDSPDDAIQDDLEDLIFDAHPLGHNILGTTATVKSFSKTNFDQFIRSSISTSKIVVSIVGNLPLARINRLTQKYFAAIPNLSGPGRKLLKPKTFSKHIHIEKPITQAHVGIGIPGFSVADKRRVPLAMLVNLLGGPGLNTRLNMQLREKMASVYAIEAHYSAFADTGLVSIFFGTELKNIAKSKKAVQRELIKLRNKPLGTLQLHRLKEQMMGQLAMAEEYHASLMLAMAKSLLDTETIQAVEEVFDDIEKVTALELQEIAQHIFDDSKTSSITFIPKEHGVYK